MIRIIILASGSGTNAENIIRYFKSKELVKITYVLSNNASAGVLEKAKSAGVKTRTFKRTEFYKTNDIIDLLKAEADFIVLAGFLWKVPQNVLDAFPNRIINIHPALLPKFGGKGMYGMNIHRAVVDNRESETGITIHYVNENYDEGKIILQKTLTIKSDETALTLENRIKILEKEAIGDGFKVWLK